MMKATATNDEPILPARVRGRPGGGRWRVGVCMFALGLAGCVLGPDYKRPDVPLPKAWQAEPKDAADLANTDWWKAFNDADLDALIETALDANKDLKLATLRVAAFDARLQVSRSANYPQIGYTASAQRRRYSQEQPTGAGGLQSGVGPIVNNFALGAVLNWEIDLWGRVKRSNEAALADLMASEDARRGVMLTVASSVAASYVELLALDQELAIARKALANRKEALALMQTKYEGGSGTRLAIEQARADVEKTASEIPPIETSIARTEGALNLLLGRNPAPVQRRTLDALALPRMPQGVPADVLTRRPDVMAAEQDLIAANARIGVAKTAYFPTLSLAAAIGLASDDLRWLFAETARTGIAGAVLAGPIYTGGRVEGEIREAELNQQQMAVRFEQSVQLALQEVEDALVTRAKSEERENAMGRRVGALREAEKLAGVRYEGGQSTYMEVLQAQFETIGAQSVQTQSRRDTSLALITVYKAMGGGWMVEYDKRKAAATPGADAQAQAQTADETGTQR